MANSDYSRKQKVNFFRDVFRKIDVFNDGSMVSSCLVIMLDNRAYLLQVRNLKITSSILFFLICLHVYLLCR